MPLRGDGVTGRAELTLAVDIATRTICAGCHRAEGTKAVDAVAVLARMVVPRSAAAGLAGVVDVRPFHVASTSGC